jgi:hypothetical protein
MAPNPGRDVPDLIIQANVPLSVLGTGLALIALVVAAAIIFAVWRRPFIGLGALVAGMAFHNFFLMVLIRLHTPSLLIRVVQGWKELVLLTLGVLAVIALVRMRGRGERWQWIPMDWIAIAFFAVLCVYLLIPARVFHSDSNLLQRLVAFRVAALIPFLYLLGRVFSTPRERDLAVVSWLIVGAGAVVGAFGLFELWFVPTSDWLGWGANLYSSWLGFTYNGPAGLPPNFFQSLPDGLLLRRMVSLYISPLGIAYTGLLVVPIAIVLMDRRAQRRSTMWIAIALSALMLTGILFAVTRLALLALVGEVFLIAFVIRTWLVWTLPPIVVAGVAFVLFGYPAVGPTVDPYLLPGQSHNQTILYIGDPSFTEHLTYLITDTQIVLQHPMGIGLGGSVHRFVETQNDTSGTGESAVFGMFGDTGILGGLLYLFMYVLTIIYGWRAVLKSPTRSLALGLPLVAAVGGLALIPITLTSDVWGDLSVTFLFWWAAGYAASVAQHSSAALHDEHSTTARQAA